MSTNYHVTSVGVTAHDHELGNEQTYVRELQFDTGNVCCGLSFFLRY